VDELWTGLVSYKQDGSSRNEVARSITSDDNKTWTIRIKPDQTFSDGTPVTAKSFVDAWNFGALGTNGQLNSYFFYPIKGFDEVQAEGTSAKTLSGLKVVDDRTLTIELSQAEADFPARLGYTAFFPLPEVAFRDLEAFGENPIGNGPYKLAHKGAWIHKSRLDLIPNREYDGPRKAANGGLTFAFYTSLESAYSDVQAGNLDVLDQVPVSAYETFEKDKNVKAVSGPGALFQSFTIPNSARHFGGEEGRLRRQAISLAINREEITDKILDRTSTPAREFSSPLMPGFNGNLAGSSVLRFNPGKAKALWARANKISPWKD
jgi:oligopeptide transport system substrate-binding protein